MTWLRHRGPHARQEILSSYLDGRLRPREREKLEGHLTACSTCREELESLRATISLLRVLPSVAPSRSFAVSEAQAGVQPAPRPWGRWQERLAPLAAGIASVLLVVVVAGDLLLPVPAPTAPASSPDAGAAFERAAEEAAPAPSLAVTGLEEGAPSAEAEMPGAADTVAPEPPPPAEAEEEGGLARVLDWLQVALAALLALLLSWLAARRWLSRRRGGPG